MPTRIENDLGRFKKIVQGKVRQNLRKYISNSGMIGRKGKDTVSIPIPQIDIPRFKHGDKGNGGVGQGEGDIGDPLGQGQDDGEGSGKAGSDGGNHILEVDISLDELAQMLAQELELPDIEPKGKEQLETKSSSKVTHRHAGLNQRVVFKPTYKRALIRSLTSGIPLEDLPTKAYPQKSDKVNRFFEDEPNPEANAAVIHMMDVSGSMADEQKEIVRTEAFWIDTWLRHKYKGLVEKYIIFDAKAKEVDEHTFYHTRESGGTRISSAVTLLKHILETDLPPEQWNLYALLYTDGDNWGEDNDKSLELIGELAKVINLFGYTQTNGPYGSGSFYKVLKDSLGDLENIRACDIDEKGEIPDAIKTLFGKGTKQKQLF